MSEPLTISVEEAARLLSISRGLAYEAARRGELPTIKLGRRLLVPRAQLRKLLGEDAPANGSAAQSETVGCRAATGGRCVSGPKRWPLLLPISEPPTSEQLRRRVLALLAALNGNALKAGAAASRHGDAA